MPTHSLYLTNSTSTSVSRTLFVITEEGQQAVIQSVTIPSAPTFTATPSNQTITLTFQPYDTIDIPLITDYQYSLDGGVTFNTMTSIQSPYTITGLTNGTTYQVQMKALNADGYGTATASQSVIPSTTPSAPTITLVTGGNGSALVYFTAPTDNGGNAITNYNISTDNGVSYFYYIFPQTTSPITINNLTNGNTYQIVLQAMNNNGFGLPSNSVSVTLLVPPTILSSATNYFKFANSFNNEVSGGLTLNVFQNSTLSVLNSKSCVSFSNDGYITSNALTSLPTLLSICFWMYKVGGNAEAFGITDGGTNGIIGELLTTYQILLFISGINSVYVENPLNDSWNHICFTINATGGVNSFIRLYINGIERGYGPNTGTGLFPSYSNYYFSFGKSADSSRRLNGGGIRHFMSFNTILSQTDITNIMNYTA